MFRKTTAVMFLVVMTVIITLKHPVFGYCLCVQTYFMGDCACEHSSNTVTSATGTIEECETGCCASTTATDEQKSPHDKPDKPCDDCTERLLVDVDDFVWMAGNEVPSETATEFPRPAYLTMDKALSAPQLVANAPARGDPLLLTATSIPVYLEHQVFRL